MSKVLVTGGLGFIGTNLTRELRDRGHDVWACDLVHGPGPQQVRADVAEYQQLQVLLREHEFEYVYHLAAEYGRWNGEDHYQNLWRTNVIGTKNVLRLQQEHGFRLIFFSSAEVYGDHEGVMTEEVMDNVAIKQMNDYAISKWAGEMQCMNHAAMFGAEIVRVRPVGCYGPHEYYSAYRGVIPIFVYHALKGRPFTVHSGHRRMFDYVDDTCATFANIIDNFVAGEVYNVGAREGSAVTIEELAQRVIDATGAHPGLIKVADEEAFTTRTKVVDSSKARRDLKHDPQIGLVEGLRRYAVWADQVYLTNGNRQEEVA